MPAPSRRVTPETLVAAFVSAFVALIAAGYLIDAAGIAMHPVLLGLAAAAGGFAGFLACREASPPPRGSLVLFGVVVTAAFGYVLWLASPSLLPISIGPDLVHHLLLIHVIQRTHHLVHGDALGPYLLEMVNYTPGAHIAAATLAGWLRVDALRVLFPLTAAFVAIKAGIVYVLALRVIDQDQGDDRRGAPLSALAAPALLLAPSAYTLGSFFHFYYYAQVVSETFAMAMVLAAIAWGRTGDRRHLWVASACAAGVFLSWPVWIGPSLAAVFTVILAASPSMRARLTATTIVVAPMAVFAVLHASAHPGGAAIIGSSGAVIGPSAETVGVAFAALGLIGALLAFRPGRPPGPGRAAASRGTCPERVLASRAMAVLLAVTALQALALAALDWRAGSTSFYMPLKMVYLAVLPGAILGALALAVASATISSRLPVLRRVVPFVPLIAALLLARGPVTRQRGPLTEPSLAAGLWARGAVPPGCVDYFTRHWLTGYWLHLDVLGNPRLSDRMRAETFDFPDVVGKWIQGKGLPYAIVDDLAAVPRDAREDMRVLREFPPAALVANTRPSAAAGSDPESALCRGK